MLNFSRQAYNEKVTDCHALFRFLRFFELGCFLGRNIDLGGSFPIQDLKFGQFWDSKKFWGLQNFAEIFSIFFVVILKKYYFPGFKSKLLLYNYNIFPHTLIYHGCVEKFQKSELKQNPSFLRISCQCLLYDNDYMAKNLIAKQIYFKV